MKAHIIPTTKQISHLTITTGNLCKYTSYPSGDTKSTEIMVNTVFEGKDWRIGDAIIKGYSKNNFYIMDALVDGFQNIGSSLTSLGATDIQSLIEGSSETFYKDMVLQAVKDFDLSGPCIIDILHITHDSLYIELFKNADIDTGDLTRDFGLIALKNKGIILPNNGLGYKKN